MRKYAHILSSDRCKHIERDLLCDPRNTLWGGTWGVGRDQKLSFSQHGHVAYQIEGNDEYRASVKRTYGVYYALRLPPDVQIELQRRTRTSEISFVRPKSIPETSKYCQKARPLLTSCMMFAPPTYRKFATCVD